MQSEFGTKNEDSSTGQRKVDTPVVVTFFKSGKAGSWTADSGSILDLAEDLGVDLPSGCRYGDCGTCMTNILQGEVAYLHETAVQADPGTCLPCSCIPITALTLDV